MKKKKKILRVRPFNMANFSGAGGYIPMYAIFGSIITFPATLILWSGLAVSPVTEDGELNIAALKRRLIIILVPVYVIALISWVLIVRSEVSFYGGSLVGFLVYAALISGIHILGMYCSIYFSANLQKRRESLSKRRWFLSTFLFASLMLIIGFIASIILMVLGT
jgi:hypothetical protein